MGKIRSIFVLALVFIIAGTVLSLENIGIISGASKLWPAFLLFLGAGFFILYFERKRSDLVLLWLGTAICLLGIFFLYLNYSSWAHMATLWPVFLGIAGTSFLVIYFPARVRVFLVIAAALIMLAGLFYLVFGISLTLWPLSLVAFGLSLLMVNQYYLKT
jgi:hypothetical protein